MNGTVTLVAVVTASSLLFVSSSFRSIELLQSALSLGKSSSFTASLPIVMSSAGLFGFLAFLASRLHRRRLFLRKTVTVDGPAASGKGAVARALAKSLNYRYIDTGSLYRAVALLCRVDTVDGRERQSELGGVSASEVASKLSIGERGEIRYGKFLVPDGDLRSEKVAHAASKVAVDPRVREEIRKLVRREICREACVIEGRDCGSKVAPEASRKFFLTADVVERARRRLFQEKRGEDEFDLVLSEILARDALDERHFTDDIRRVDCTWLSVEETVKLMV